jgi:hypothetical protein
MLDCVLPGASHWKHVDSWTPAAAAAAARAADSTAGSGLGATTDERGQRFAELSWVTAAAVLQRFLCVVTGVGWVGRACVRWIANS